MRPNKLKRLSLETLSSKVLKFEDKARANAIGAPFRCFLLGYALCVSSKCLTRLERDCQLLAYWALLSVTKEKCFITLTPGANDIKYFTVVI
jgi:hypothetical protein